MNTLLVALFGIGIGIGMVLRAYQPKVQRPISQSDKLDTIDEMFLYGEVTDDEFYRM